MQKEQYARLGNSGNAVKSWQELQAECEDLIVRHKVIQDATLDQMSRLKLLLKETQAQLDRLEKIREEAAWEGGGPGGEWTR
jgi:hypothetical protein